MLLNLDKWYLIIHKRRFLVFYTYGEAVNYCCSKKWNGRYNKLPFDRIIEKEVYVVYNSKNGDIIL